MSRNTLVQDCSICEAEGNTKEDGETAGTACVEPESTAPICLSVSALDFSENRFAIFGPMLLLATCASGILPTGESCFPQQQSNTACRGDFGFGFPLSAATYPISARRLRSSLHIRRLPV